MKKWIVLLLVLSVSVVLSGFQAQAASSNAAKIAALEAEIAQLKADRARIAAIERAIVKISENAAKDIEDRNRLNKGLGEIFEKLGKRVDSTETSLLALSNRQEALGKEQQALANGYQAAVNAAVQEARRKNQVANVPSTAVQNQEQKTQNRLKTWDEIETIISQALTATGLSKEDRELLCLYDIYSQRSDMGEYKKYLKEIGQWAKFTQIEQVARQLTQTGIFRPGIVRLWLGERRGTVAVDLSRKSDILSQMLANYYKEKKLAKLGKPQFVRVPRKDNDREDSDSFYARTLGISPIDWSFLRHSEKDNDRKDSDDFYVRTLGISPIDWSFLRK